MSTPEIRPGVRRLLRLALRRPDQARAEADEEIQLHLALRVAQLEREGLSPGAARAEAERRFGPPEAAREQVRASAAGRDRRLRWSERLGDAAQALRLAARAIRRAPGFAATVVVCIALGVGANAAAFSLLDELIRRPLPVRDAERLVNLAAPGPNPGSDSCNQSGTCAEVFSLPMYRDLARRPPRGSPGSPRIASSSPASRTTAGPPRARGCSSRARTSACSVSRRRADGCSALPTTSQPARIRWWS
jgi:hypothetical protein